MKKSEVSLSDRGGSPGRESVTVSSVHSVSLANQSTVKRHLCYGHLRDQSCVLTPGICVVTVIAVMATPRERDLDHFLVSLWPEHAAVLGKRAPGQWPMDDKCVQRDVPR